MNEFLRIFEILNPIAPKHIVKILFLMSLASQLLITNCKAQVGNKKPNSSITLIIKNSPPQMFTLWVRNPFHEVAIDSAMLGTKGDIDTLHFEFIVVGKEAVLGLGFSKRGIGRFVPVLANGEHLEIIADINQPGDITFAGSARTREFFDFSKQRLNMDVGSKYRIALNAGSADSIALKQKIDSVNHLNSLFLRKRIFNTECGFVVAFLLMDSQNGVVNYTKKELSQLREKFKDDSLVLKQIDINENLQERSLNPKLKPANGTYLADFTLLDFNGRKVSLAQFKGKYVFLDFWASWCGPCRKQAPYLKEMFKHCGKSNLVILTVSLDQNHDDWKKAIIQDGIGVFVNLIDDREKEGSVKNKYNIELIPSNFLLDPAGKVLDSDLKGEKLVARVAEVMKTTN